MRFGKLLVSASAVCLFVSLPSPLLLFPFLALPLSGGGKGWGEGGVMAQEISPPRESRVTLDFNNIDLPVFVKFISELTRKNFVIDERVKGKVTIFSPTKISTERAYQVFLSVLEMKGLTAVPVGDVIQILPSSEVPPEKAINVYALENAAAEEMAKVLSGLVTRAVPVAPGRPAVKTPGEFEGPVQILPDKATNSLIITSTPKDYELLTGLIKKLDTKRRQVFVEAVIMEIGVDKIRAMGGEVGALFGYSQGDLTVVGGFNPEGINLPTGAAASAVTLRPLNVQAVLRLLQSSSEANILSTPQILTSDGQKAEIVVGQNVPFVTGQTVQPGGTAISTLIERKDVGVTLRITPQVLENGLVKLDIFQEISTVTETPQVIGNFPVGPTTNKRSANTSVIVEDKQTVVIAGLLKDNILKTEKKIPFFGDIPLLGWFFKFRKRTVEKTNLLIFLTPTVVKDTSTLVHIKKEKSGSMEEFMEENKVEGREKRKATLHPPDPVQEPVNPPAEKEKQETVQ